VIESYYCNFGLNPEYRELLDAAGLIVSGWDEAPEAHPSAAQTTAEARVIELPEHQFFLATLFVPQTNSTPERPHPLIAVLCASLL
jgi:CTP synthase (UTP-ammonia lyase)